MLIGPLLTRKKNLIQTLSVPDQDNLHLSKDENNPKCGATANKFKAFLM